MTASPARGALARVSFRRWTLADVVVILVAAKPLLDAVSERSRDVRLDAGSVWTLMALVLVAYDVLRRRRARPEVWAIRAAVAVLIGTGVLRGLLEQNPSIALEWTRVAAGFAPAAILLGVRRGRDLADLLWRWRIVFVSSISIHVVVAWLQFFGVVSTTYRQAGMGRPSGLYFHPITLGYLLVATLLVLALLDLRGRLPRWLALGATGVAYATIIVTTHRTSFIAASIVLASWAVIALARARRLRLRFTVSLSLGLLLVGMVGALTAPAWSATATRATTGLTDVLTTADLDVTSDRFLRGRGERWGNAIAMLESADALELLFGYGYEVVDPHSDYLRLPLVHGVMGSLVVLTAVAAFWLAFSRRGDGWSRTWLIAALAVMALFAVTAKPTSYPSFMWAWTIVAIVSTTSGPPVRGRHGLG